MTIKRVFCRKECNDQESIHILNTFRPRHQRKGGRTESNGTTIKTLQVESQKDDIFQKKKKKKWPNGYPKFHQDLHAKTYNDKPQQKHLLGMVSKIDFTWPQPSSLALPWNARHLFSPCEGFLTHQCNISENIKIKRIQGWNNDEDSTARNNWNAETKENKTFLLGALEY